MTTLDPTGTAGRKTLGLIGSGNIGSTLARLALAAGYEVALSNSRGPDTLADLVRELGPGARATDAAGAAAADLVVVTIPLRALADVPVEPLTGRTVIDTMNYYPQRDGVVAELEDGTATTSGLLQTHLPTSKVVKAFNNIFFKHLGAMGRRPGDPDRNTLLLAGDHPEANATVAAFMDDLGYDALDTGPLADSWRFERDQPAYAGAYIRNGSFDLPPTPASAARLTGLLAQARRPVA